MPSIDFFADTKLTRARVFLSVRGPLGAAKMRLSSSPAMSQTQIVQLLTLRDAYREGSTNMNAGDLLAVGLQMTFLSEVEGIMRNYLALDKLTITRGSGSMFASQLSPKEKENDENNRYGVQYDINDHWGLTLERESNDYVIGVEARMTF